MADKKNKLGSKRYTAIRKTVERGLLYAPDDAVALVKKNATAKFDESIDVAINLNITSKHTVRDTVALPNSFGKEKRVLVFAKGEKAEEAKNAGAEYVGAEDLIEKIKGGWVDFDVAIATPDMMKDVGKLGQVLGKRGLMPNPKTGTVTMNVGPTVKAFRQGRAEFRADKAGVIRMAIGKASMAAEQIRENLFALYEEVQRKRPTDIKGEFVRSVVLSSTMGVGLKIDLKKIK